MKTFFAIYIFCSILLFANVNHARKEPAGEHYWKSVMKDQPMPEAIKGLLHQQDPASALGSDKKINRFVKDFDSRHSFIIYHTGPDSKQENKDELSVNKDLKNQKQHKSDKKN